jgi:hypothetical protein
VAAQAMNRNAAANNNFLFSIISSFNYMMQIKAKGI